MPELGSEQGSFSDHLAGACAVDLLKLVGSCGGWGRETDLTTWKNLQD